MKKMDKWIIGLLIVSLLIISACSSSQQYSRQSATIYKSPTCGCCVGYSGHLKSAGFEVIKKDTNAMDEIHKKYNIPPDMESCHTVIIGDYFVEGHVPIEVVDKLLEEKPDIDGISLPRMPSGSPGMPGPKRGLWTIYALKDGKTSEFMVI